MLQQLKEKLDGTTPSRIIVFLSVFLFLSGFSGIAAIVVTFLYKTKTIFLAIFLFSLLLLVCIAIFLTLIHLKQIYMALVKLKNYSRDILAGDFSERFVAGPVPEVDEVCGNLKNIAMKMMERNNDLEKIVKLKISELRDVNEITQNNEKIMHDLEMAKRVQRGIMPDYEKFPHIKEVEIGAEYEAMESLGGDIYDVIRVGRNSYGFLIADVSGHGVPAALITTMAKVSFNTNSGWGVDPAEVCSKVNRDLYQFIGDLGYYLTAYFGVIDLETGYFTFANAAHQPAILFRKDTSSIEPLDSEGFFIGSMEKPVYKSDKIKLNAGDKILFFTDGIIEARNKKNEFYTLKRLERFFLENSDLTPKKFVEKLISDVENFSDGRPSDDDRTVLFFEFNCTVNVKHESESIKIEAIQVRA